MAERVINLTLRVWRQSGPNAPGRFETYPARNISVDMSFLEMLDTVNRELQKEGKNRLRSTATAARAFAAHAAL
jgi:succinate dehydrogenase / fumarate reductase iron-sulfur subunit